MPKTCLHSDCTYNVWGKGYCQRHQYLRTDKKAKVKGVELDTFKKKKPIKPVSNKLKKERKFYAVLRVEFLERIENMFCAVYPHLRSDQIHHMRGRGIFLNDTNTWIAVSDAGHKWIESNPKLARERGFTKSRLHLTDELNNN